MQDLERVGVDLRVVVGRQGAAGSKVRGLIGWRGVLVVIGNVARWAAVGAIVMGFAARGYGADVVETTAGQRVVGAVTLGPQGALVRGEDGQETAVAWDKLKEMTRDSVQKARVKGAGTGLKMEVFAHRDFKAPVALRMASAVDFEWSGRSSAGVQEWKDFIVRWTGKLEPAYSETYRFTAVSGERIKVWVKGKLLVDQLHAGPEKVGTVDLQAGEKVDLQVEMEKLAAVPYARVYWESASQGKEVVPADRLYLPEGFGAGDVENYLLAAAERGAVKAEYFEDATFTKLKRVQLERPSLWAGFVQPDPALQAKNTAARWTVVLAPTRTDRYALAPSADWGGATRLFVEGKMVAENWVRGEAAEQGRREGKARGQWDMEAGKRYEVKMETMAFSRGLRGRLEWGSEHSTWHALWPADCVVPDDMPRVAVVAPLADAVVDGASSVELKALVKAGPAMKGEVKRVEFYDGDKLVGSVEKEPYVVRLERPLADANVIVAKAVADELVEARSAPVRFMGTVAADKMGDGWRDGQIGAGGVPMGIEKNGDQWTLTSGKGELLGGSDAVRFVHRTLDGDGEIVAKIDAVEGKKDLLAMAGVSIRDALGATDHAVSLVVTSKAGGQAVVIARASEGATSATLDLHGAGPYWVKLARRGDEMRAYWGRDGVKWEQAGEWRIHWGPRTFAGVVVLGDGERDAGGNRAVLEGIHVHEGGPEMAATREGVILRTGSFLAGEILSVDGQAVVVKHAGGEKKYATADVAMVVFNPLSVETAEGLGSGKVGAILASGDFFDGELQSFKKRQATVVSVVFGAKTFETRDLAAIVLHDGAARKSNWVVELADGSRVLAKSLKWNAGKMVAEDVGGEMVTVEGPAVTRVAVGN